MRHRSRDNQQAIRKAETPKTCNYRTRGCRAWNKEINYRDSSQSATAEESADVRGEKNTINYRDASECGNEKNADEI